MRKASYYKSLENRMVRCQLCPHQCLLKPGQSGNCHVRLNSDGELVTTNYGVLSAIATDPIEKKPLYHFYPGGSILSIGSYGCNLRCDFCQNCEISQVEPEQVLQRSSTDPGELVKSAVQKDHNIGLAFTYNEPTIYFEFMMECAIRVKEQGRSNVMVTNGYISRDPLEALLPVMDAFNVDLKSFRDEFYRKRSGGNLRPVLETIQRIAESDSHLELTFLLIPGCNDTEEEWHDMIRWITGNCGKETILHVSRYFPRYKLRQPPTPLQQMERFLELARESIHYVYAGNAPQLESHTYCPACGDLLISRNMYHTSVHGIGAEGSCMKCGYNISGIFRGKNQ